MGYIVDCFAKNSVYDLMFLLRKIKPSLIENSMAGSVSISESKNERDFSSISKSKYFS